MGNKSTRRLVYAVLLLVYLLHNDLWLWHDSSIVLGLPVGLLYHVGFCAVASVSRLLRGGLGDPVPPGSLLLAPSAPVLTGRPRDIA